MSKTHQECLHLLERIRWNGKPQCPYCGSIKASPLKHENRYHCNKCFTSYSVTVGTLFHKTHVSLSKWFQAICFVVADSEKVSVRQLAERIDVNKNTAAYMLTRIKTAEDQTELLEQIANSMKDKDF